MNCASEALLATFCVVIAGCTNLGPNDLPRGLNSEIHIESIDVGSEQVYVEMDGADDFSTCSLKNPKGNEVLRVGADYGMLRKRINITALLGEGVNKLTCGASDKQNGRCYSYRFNLITDPPNPRLPPPIQDSCCEQPRCSSEKGFDVIDFTYIIKVKY